MKVVWQNLCFSKKLRIIAVYQAIFFFFSFVSGDNRCLIQFNFVFLTCCLMLYKLIKRKWPQTYESLLNMQYNWLISVWFWKDQWNRLWLSFLIRKETELDNSMGSLSLLYFSFLMLFSSLNLLEKGRLCFLILPTRCNYCIYLTHLFPFLIFLVLFYINNKTLHLYEITSEPDSSLTWCDF
jgi:hypothetical protein